MIISLTISDFVLIDFAGTSFKPGLNVLTGETGSGKSAVIDALNQILGARADTGLIRKGQDKAIVEALFDISHLQELQALLESMGISHEGPHLHIKREIAKDGKGRIWINRESAPLNALRTIGPSLMEFVSQRANKDLFESENHLEILDTICGLMPLRDEFKEAYLSHLKKEKEIKYLIENKEDASKKRTKDLEDLKEIESESPKPDEEEALFDEYSLLSNVEELKVGLLSIHEILNGDGILQTLSLVRKKLDEFKKIDGSLKDSLDMTVEAIANMKEVERSIDLKLSNLDASPERLIYLESRLKAFARLKKYFGPTMEDVIKKWDALKLDSQNSDNTDEIHEKLVNESNALKAKADALSTELRSKRKALSKDFSERVTTILKTLNMQNALFTTVFQERARHTKGDDSIEFFLSPNLGENPVSVSRHASGGELSRVLLAIKLMEENSHASIVFDEIDANIGGNTAVMVGEKLKKLSDRKQVILITHFPQVARFACHHIKISKKESEGRTFTEIESLEDKNREEELLRMLGGLSLK